MNVTFQKLNTAYRPSVPAQTRQTPKAGKVKGDYDTVNIRRSQAAPEDDETFARMLARKAAAQLGFVNISIIAQVLPEIPDRNILFQYIV